MGESAQTLSRWEASCCVVGGGPAGMMLGYLLARAGVEVIVLEKHADFFRDFRGDTIHPFTLELMAELGLLEEFLQLPHTRVPEGGVVIGEKHFNLIDFRHLPTRCKFMAMMPQWDFLNFIATKAKRYPTFRLEMNANVTDVLERGNKIVGVRPSWHEGSPVQSALRRAVVPATKKCRCSSDARLLQGWWGGGYHRPRGLLAMRHHHREGRIRGDQGTGARGIPQPHRPHSAHPALCSQRANRLGTGQVALGTNGPSRAVVSPWPAVHRRCCPRHVTSGGCWSQLHHPGCGCSGEPAG